MRAVLELDPTTNFAVAAPGEKSDQMEALSRVLMGLSHSVTLIAAVRETDTEYEWTTPPRLCRRWLAVVTADDTGTLTWRTRTLKNALEGVGLRCEEGNGHQRSADWNVPHIVGRQIGNGHSGDDLRDSGSDDPIHHGLNSDAIRLSNAEYCASLVLRRWPREVAPGWLGQALAGDMPVDVALHIQPQDVAWVARKLKLQQMRHADSDDAGDVLSTRDAQRVREDLIARKDRPVKVAVVFTVRARDRYQLKNRVETLRHEVGLALGDARLVKYEQDRGLEATLPTGECRLLGAYKTLDCTSVASTWIWQPATVNHVNGVDIGVTRKGSMLVRLDPFDAALEGFSGVIVGKKRMGKSYLMKIIARGLAARGVEVTIIEQRRPPEYGVLAHLPNIEVINIEEVATDEEDADLQIEQRVAFLRKFTSELWDRARAHPKPRMLIVDEAWMLLRHAQSAAWIEQVARTGGHFGLALWILSQQVRELLATGRAALDNSEVRIFLKQHDADLDNICDAVGLSVPARQYLRGAARGQILLGVGDLWIEVDVARVPEHYEISTDPRDVWDKEKRNHDAGMGRLEDSTNGWHADPVGSAAAVGVAGNGQPAS